MRMVLIGVAAVILLAILGFVALVVGGYFAGPALLRAKQEANEAATIATLRTILSAQFTYAAVCGQGSYAPTFEALARPAPGESTGYLPGEFSGVQEVVRSGYKITMAGAAAPEAAASCNGVPPGKSLRAFSVTATPEGDGSARYFGTNTDGTVYVATAPFTMPETGVPSGATPVQ